MKPSSQVMAVIKHLTRGGRAFMRAAVTTGTLFLSVDAHCAAHSPESADRQQTLIPAEDLDSALRALEKERGLELIFFAEDLRGIRTRGARGNINVEETLKRLLAGTGLTYHLIDASTVSIMPAARPRLPDSRARGDLRPEPTDEVVVTAQKRAEYAQSVPESVSAIEGSRLEELGATRLTDYAAYLSGLTVVQGAAPGEDMLILRGLGIPSESTLVATYIDDTPVGASSGQLPTTRRALDLLPYDFERIEVLEGPQGTLYGANAMGGLVKYVTRKPDLDTFSAQVGTDFKENYNASEAGWSARGSLNLPILTDAAALRASLSQDFTPGFIDQPDQGRTDSNQAREQVGHLALLLAPSQSWSANLSGLIQHLDSADPAAVTLTTAFMPDTGRLSNSTLIPGSFDSRLQYYSASIDRELQWASVTSATSYATTQSSAWGQAYYPFNLFTQRADSGLLLSSNKLTQELRLTSASGGNLEWLVGVFYTLERGDQFQVVEALNTSNEAVANPQLNPLLHVFVPSRYQEDALFGNGTWKLTDALDLTAGLRESHNRQTFGGAPTCSLDYVSMIGPCPEAGVGTSHQNVFNFSAGSSYHFTTDVLGYFRAASGYRPGGPNVPGQGIPSSVAADTLISEEIGLKSVWLDRTLRFNAAIYQVDWNHIQIFSIAPPPVSITYGANGNTANVRGVESAAAFSPATSLHFGLNLTYTHAVLSAPMPAGSTLVGDRGDRLPYIPLWSGSLTADYAHVLRHNWVGTLGGSWRYMGQRFTTIDNVGNCPTNCAGASSVPSLRPYGVIDLHAGVADDTWNVHLSVRNLTNKYALVDMSGSGNQTFDSAPIEATVLSSRLITLGVDRQF